MGYSNNVFWQVKDKNNVVYDVKDAIAAAILAGLGTTAANGDDPNAPGYVAAHDKTVKEAITEDIAAAVASLASTLKGNKASDDATDETIAGAKAYADAIVANLAGTNWSENAKKVQEIIAEIENSDNANGWTTAIDKLAGLGNKSEAVYYTAEDEEVINGIKKVGDIKTPAVPNKVKDYVDAAVQGASSNASSAIAALDAVETSSNGTNIQVTVTEVDGVITDVSVSDSTINATDLSNKVGSIDVEEYGTSGETGYIPARTRTVKEYVDETVGSSIANQTKSTVSEGVLILGI